MFVLLSFWDGRLGLRPDLFLSSPQANFSTIRLVVEYILKLTMYNVNLTNEQLPISCKFHSSNCIEASSMVQPTNQLACVIAENALFKLYSS